MSQSSFRSSARDVIPSRNRCKLALLLVVALAAGCGGSGDGGAERTVRGTGYSFAAPSDWTVTRSGREVRVADGIALVSVTRFPLVREFRPSLWKMVVPELDRAAEAVATQQDGVVSARETVTIAGRRARRYDVSYTAEGKELVERLGFVLRGKTEYLLLCRYEDGGDTDACERLLATFTLG